MAERASAYFLHQTVSSLVNNEWVKQQCQMTLLWTYRELKSLCE